MRTKEDANITELDPIANLFPQHLIAAMFLNIYQTAF